MAEDTSALPPEHKKRLFQGIAAWLVLCLLAGLYVWVKAPQTLAELEARTPHATAPIMVRRAGSADAGGGEAVPLPVGGTYLSLVMTDLGLSQEMTERALDDLPVEVALAFSPYSADLDKWLRAARGSGFEPLLLLPMEPRSYPLDDPGPKAILSRAPLGENSARLESLLAAAPGIIGVVNFLGGAGLLSDMRNLEPVFETLKNRGLMFIEDPQGSGSHAAEVAESASLPYLGGAVVIDETATEQDIRRQLLALERAARERGHAVGIAHPHPVTFTVIRAWANGLKSRGVTLLPVSSLLKVKERHAGR